MEVSCSLLRPGLMGRTRDGMTIKFWPRHLLGQEGLHGLHEIAARFEERVYAKASSKMHTMEAKKVATSPPSNLERHHVLDVNINSGQRPP